MNDAPRYRLVGYDIGTAPDENGGWVHWTDHEAIVARLTAERDRFEAALGRACLVGGTTYLVDRAEKAEAERDAALVGAVKVKPLNWQDFANIEAGPVGINGDNLAVALCSYFDGHMACPDDGEDGSELDEYDCWKVWVSENSEDVLRRIAQVANARVLSAIQSDPEALQADLAKAWTLATAAMAERAKSELSAAWAADLIVQWAQSLLPPADLAAKIGGE